MPQSINGMGTDQFKEYLSENVFNRKPQEGGFFPLPDFPHQKIEEKKCNNLDHDPPMHLHIPQGQGYKHVCPSCGKTRIIIRPQIS